MIFKGISDETKAKLIKLSERIYKKPQGDFEVNFKNGDSFEVKKEGNQLFVSFSDDSQLYRSLLLCTQLIFEGKDGVIKEEKQFDCAGVMLDMSRAGVMTVSSLKEYMDYMALMGLNSLMLYMEDVYEVDGYDYFGYMRGRYSKEELQEIDRYGQSLNIEVIPCIQTLGHFEQYIKWAEGKKMSDTNNALMVGLPEVYEFIDKIVGTVSECFATRKIHIGMDEVWGMGTGNYLKKFGLKDGTEIFCEHIKKVKEITDKYNLKPMIWSDMFFRLGSETHQYYDLDVKDLTHIKPMVPEDLGLVYWDYYHTDEKTYKFMTDRHFEMTDNVIFAGGIWLWRGFVPDYAFTIDSTNAALSVCKKEGIKDVYATAWGDDGCETDGRFSLVGSLLYGEHAYNENVNDEDFNTRCCLLFGADVSDFRSMTDVLYPFEKFEWGKPSLTIKQIIYSDVLCGFMDAEIEDAGLVDLYAGLYEKYKKLSEKDGYFKKHYEYIKDICILATHKIKISQLLFENYKKNDEVLREIKDKLLPELSEDFCRLKAVHYEIWHTTYKPFGFEVVDGRYGNKLSRIESAIRRLDDYLLGRIDSLPELSEKRLAFNGAMPFATTHNAIVSGFLSRGY